MYLRIKLHSAPCNFLLEKEMVFTKINTLQSNCTCTTICFMPPSIIHTYSVKVAKNTAGKKWAVVTKLPKFPAKWSFQISLLQLWRHNFCHCLINKDSIKLGHKNIVSWLLCCNIKRISIS